MIAPVSIVSGPHCGPCPHRIHGQRYIPPFGTGANGILEVGDSPWVDEIREGRPFCGAAGVMRQRILRRLGMTENDFCITNSQNCKPSHLGWTEHPERYPAAAEALAHCQIYLDELIETLKPRVIIPLGNVALRRVCGLSGIEENHAYVHSTHFGIPAVPTFHPSFIMQENHKLTPAVSFAYRRAQEIAEKGYHPTQDTLLLDAAPDDIRSYLNRFPVDIPIALVDIETPESSHLDEEEAEGKGMSYQIVRSGFCIEPNVGVTFPHEPPYLDILREVLKRSQQVVEWADNHFDTRRLRAAGFSIPGKVWSGMWCWHMVQSDLPKGLGFVAPFFFLGPPWKYLSDAQPAFYNACDQVRGWDCTMGSMEELKRQGRWKVFERHCIEMESIFIPASQAGVRIDREAQAAFKAQLVSEYAEKLDQLQKQTPEQIRTLHPKQGYSKRPLSNLPPGNVVDKSDDLPEEIREVLLHHARLVERDFPVIRDGVEATEQRWAWLRPFNPSGSAPDTKNLIRSLGLKVPINRRKGDDAETTEAKHLRRLSKKRPLLRTILDCRERQKLIGSYMWPTDENGYIHPSLGFHPSTWRKSMRNPNAQTIPKRNDLAKAFRRMIVASPGNVLLAFDSSAIEAVLVGWLAGSVSWVRLAKAGIHGWLMSHTLGDPIPLNLPDAALAVCCKAMKKRDSKEYDIHKRIVYLSTYGGTPERIAEEYPDDFPDIEKIGPQGGRKIISGAVRARELQDRLFSTAPGQDIRRWQRQVCDLASRETKLTTVFGITHYFFDVYTYDKRQAKWRWGKDAKRAIAFRPQSMASSIQDLILLSIRDAAPWLFSRVLAHPFRLPVHDELVFDIPESRWREAAPIIYRAFTQKWPQLPFEGGYLSIGCEGSIGPNLGEMRTLTMEEVGG